MNNLELRKFILEHKKNIAKQMMKFNIAEYFSLLTFFFKQYFIILTLRTNSFFLLFSLKMFFKQILNLHRDNCR